MARKYVFVDEAGNFDFSGRGSRFIVLTSVTLDHCALGDELLALRRELVWDGIALADAFHAAQDTQRVRYRVFSLISQHALRIDATIFDKEKVVPERRGEELLYGLAWRIHMERVAPAVVRPEDDLLIVGASPGARRRQETLAALVRASLVRVSGAHKMQVAYWPASTDPCLQIADYCCWAIQ